MGMAAEVEGNPHAFSFGNDFRRMGQQQGTGLIRCRSQSAAKIVSAVKMGIINAGKRQSVASPHDGNLFIQ